MTNTPLGTDSTTEYYRIAIDEVNKLHRKIEQQQDELASCIADLDREVKIGNDLMAENAKYREALESIAANICCDRCQEAALVAREALK